MTNFFLILLFAIYISLGNCEEFPNSKAPDRKVAEYEDISGDGSYLLKWEYYPIRKAIRFFIIAETTGYVGFGISPNGGMLGADIVVGGAGEGTLYFSDRYGVGYVMPVVDDQEDWQLLSGGENGTHTWLTIERDLDTCDKAHDVAITADTTRLIWSLGDTDELLYHGSTRRGAYLANLLDPPMPIPDPTKYEKWTLERTMTMPSAKTSYWCTMHRSPADITSNRHVVGFTTVLNSSLSLRHTHHLNVYLCTAPEGQDPEDIFGPLVNGPGGECYEPNPIMPIDLCRTMVYVWAVGGKPMFFPEDVGYPIAEGGKTEFVMLEIHYNNPEEMQGLTFTSAVEIHYTAELRPKEAAVLTTAHSITFSHLIPGNARNFVSISHCGSECTGRKINPEGINFVNVMLHSHLLGRKMKLRHFRGRTELPWIASDDNYDFDYQQNRPLRDPVNVRPGDHLTMECTTDSTGRPGITLGGMSTSAEMCQGIIWYYPRGELRFCESAYPEWNVLEKFGIEGITWENILEPPIVTAPESMANKTFIEVVDALGPWTSAEIAEFQYQVRYTDHYEVSCGRTPIPDGFKRFQHLERIMKAKADPVMVGYPDIDGEYAPEDQCEGITTTTTTTTTTTEKPVESTTPAPQICPPDGIHRLPYPGNCTLYYFCINGVPSVESCAPGLQFDPITKDCRPEELVDCFDGAICPEEGRHFLPYPGNCTLYIICDEGTPYVQSCGPELLFDPILKKCNLPHLVDCEDELTKCPDGGGIFYLPIRGDPQSYIFCFQGQPKVLMCEIGLIFDKHQNMCLPG